jgi:Transposase DDE domain
MRTRDSIHRKRSPFFGPERFTYEPEHDRYICPAGQPLNYGGESHHNHSWTYIGTRKRCGPCALRPQCTSAAFRCLVIHQHEPARQRARELANTPEFAKAQRQRKKVEALFAELKNQIGLRRLRLRRMKFVREQFFMAAAAQNIKRLVRFLSPPTELQPLTTWKRREELNSTPPAHTRPVQALSFSTPTDVIIQAAVDSPRPLQYAVEMAEPIKTDLGSQVSLWIRKNAKESSRLEFKLKLEIGTPGGKAEFIRDVIALAYSEGETPREDGYLVVGFKDGRFHNKDEHYDGATFGQILDSYIYPVVNYTWKAFEVEGESIGVLILKPDAEVVYVVNKKLQDENGRVLLSPGQCLGRRADRKIDLSGEAIHERLQEIANGQVEEATSPLRKRIKHLERNSGSAFEVKRIRFEMERVSVFDALDEYLDKLLPYAREFDASVKHEVLDAVMDVTGAPGWGCQLRWRDPWTRSCWK